MDLLVFDGSYDAYFWVLCVDKYCKVRGISEMEKMTLVAMAMSGCALRWWNWWSPRHPEVSWNMFTIALLWRFKPEDRCILPIVDDEEEPDQELYPLVELSGNLESLDAVIEAWDEFLTSTEQINVPTVNVKNSTMETVKEIINTIELVNDTFPISDELFPSMDASEEQPIVDESIAVRNLKVEEVMPMSEILGKSLEPPFTKRTTLLSHNLAPVQLLSAPPWKELRWMYSTLKCLSCARLNDEMSLPPPKPPDFPQMHVEFKVKCSHIMPPPPPEPPNATSTVVNTTVLPFYVATVICPLSVWKNACVNCMEINVELSNVSIYLNFNEVFIDDTSNDICVLEIDVKSDIVAIWPSSFVLPLSELLVNPNLFVGTYTLWLLQPTFGNSSRHSNHNAYSGSKHMDFKISVSEIFSLHPHPHIAIMSLVNNIADNALLSQSLESFVHDFIDMLVECMEIFYDYSIGSTLEFFVVVLGLAKLVDNGNFSLSSFLFVGSFGYTISLCGYMNVLNVYGVVFIEVWTGKQTMERIVSLNVGGCTSLMQYQQVFFSTCVLPSVLTWVCLFKAQQRGLSENVIHEAFTPMALIVAEINKLEYLLPYTYLATCVSCVGLDAGSCWRLIQFEILVDIMMVWKYLLTNKVQLYALVQIFFSVQYRHVTYKNLLPSGDYVAQSIDNLICNSCTLALIGLEDILQQLQKLVTEPYDVHLLSYMQDLSHMEVVGLLSLSAIICVVAAIEDFLLAMPLSITIYKRSSSFGIQPMAFKQSANYGNITCTTPSLFIGNTILHSIMAYAGNNTYVEIHCYDFSTMIDICEVRPWALTDLTINLCKSDAVMDDKSHTKSFYEDVLVYRSFCFDPEKLIPLAADRRVAWVCKIIRGISSAQRPNSPPVQILNFHRWDPGKKMQLRL